MLPYNTHTERYSTTMLYVLFTYDANDCNLYEYTSLSEYLGAMLDAQEEGLFTSSKIVYNGKVVA